MVAFKVSPYQFNGQLPNFNFELMVNLFSNYQDLCQMTSNIDIHSYAKDLPIVPSWLPISSTF